jgi:ligand-binding SRPBCC domain-containing protein
MMSRRHTLLRHQILPRAREEVFSFFSDIRNLEQITPPFLRFRNVGSETVTMERGAMVEHELSLFFLPMKWRSLIEIYEPPIRFADRQIRGPYRYWLHLHEFEVVPEGTEMTDRVEYELPFGPLGEIAHPVVVKKMLREIFDFRRRRLAEIFGVAS